MSDELTARIASLEATVAELVEEIRRLRRRPTMAQLQRCTSCGGALWHFPNVRERGNSAHTVPFTLHKLSAFWSDKDRAPLAAYACRACGLVEWHASELDEIEEAADAVAIEPPDEPPLPSDGPFR